MAARPRWTATRAVLLAIGTAVLAVAGTAHGGDKPMAESLFQLGKKLMAEGNLAEACPKFAESLRVDPAVGAALNLALCHELQGKTATAWAEFRQAATMARAAGQPERERGALDRAAKLEARLSRLTIDVPEPVAGLTIRRNDVELGQGSWGAPIAVDPDSYRITASAPGYRTWTTTATVGRDGDVRRVVVPSLDRAAADDAPANGSDDSDVVHYALATTATGVGLFGVVLGTVFGVRAMTKWNDAQDQYPNAPELCDEACADLNQEARDAATVSTVGFVVGGMGAAAAAVLWLTSPVVLGEAETPGAEAATHVVPLLSHQAAGVSLLGVF